MHSPNSIQVNGDNPGGEAIRLDPRIERVIAIIEANSSPPVKSSEMPPSSSGSLLMAPLFPFRSKI